MCVSARGWFKECKKRRKSPGQFPTNMIEVMANVSQNFSRYVSKGNPTKVEFSCSAKEGNPQQDPNVTQLHTEACEGPLLRQVSIQADRGHHRRQSCRFLSSVGTGLSNAFDRLRLVPKYGICIALCSASWVMSASTGPD